MTTSEISANMSIVTMTANILSMHLFCFPPPQHLAQHPAQHPKKLIRSISYPIINGEYTTDLSMKVICKKNSGISSSPLMFWRTLLTSPIIEPCSNTQDKWLILKIVSAVRQMPPKNTTKLTDKTAYYKHLPIISVFQEKYE